MHPIPVLHGCTVGELAQMINGEGWLAGKRKCKLTVIPVKGWKHGDSYSLPVKPSPNLPNDQAIALYPRCASSKALPSVWVEALIILFKSSARRTSDCLPSDSNRKLWKALIKIQCIKDSIVMEIT